MTSTDTPARSARRIVCVRLSYIGLAEIDRLAQAAGVDRSTMIRTLLAEAIHAQPLTLPGRGSEMTMIFDLP